MKQVQYKKYKNSGIAWIGEVPSHWENWKIAHGFYVIGSGTTPNTDDLSYYDGNIPWVTTSELRERDIFDTTTKLTQQALQDIPTLRKYPIGSLLFAMYGATIGRLGVLQTEATVNQACCVFAKPKVFEPKYVFYWFQMSRNTLIAFSSGGGQPNLNKELLKLLRIPAPTLPEQKSIAEFLDRETTRIDALIQKKESFIKLLDEKRLSLITRALTKGLDPKTKFKDSEIDWVGKMPANWNKIRLKFLLTKNLQYGANAPAEFDDPSLPRYVRITDIDENSNLREDTFRSLPEEIANLYLLNEGDLLFARSGATVGKTFLYKSSWGRCAYAGYLIKASLNTKKVNPLFAYYFTRSAIYLGWVSSITIQATIQNVSAEKYASLWIPLPPLDEQSRITDYILAETGKIENLINKTKEAILKLQEYRTALISAAVTGKINVSNYEGNN